MSLPAQLRRDILDCFYIGQEAFSNFLEAAAIAIPSLSIRPTERYYAFYLGSSPIVYIEPQNGSVKLGFFRHDIGEYIADPKYDFKPFAEWNTSHGGLVCYELVGFDDALKTRLEIGGMLLAASFEKRSGRPAPAINLG